MHQHVYVIFVVTKSRLNAKGQTRGSKHVYNELDFMIRVSCNRNQKYCDLQNINTYHERFGTHQHFAKTEFLQYLDIHY